MIPGIYNTIIISNNYDYGNSKTTDEKGPMRTRKPKREVEGGIMMKEPMAIPSVLNRAVRSS